MDLAPLLYVIRVVERSLLLLFCRLLLMISTIFTVSTIPTIYSVDLSIVLLLLPRKPLVMWFKEPGSSLNGDVSDCKQIEHRFRLFRGDLLHGLDITDSIVEGIDDLYILDVRVSIPGVAEIFHVVPDAFIKLMFNGLQSFYCRQTLICALKFADEYGT
jgi:hypothetical protein